VPIYIGTGAVNPISADRKLLPAYIQLGERNETWELSAKHTVANTTAVVTVAGDSISNRDWRSIDRYVGELKPYPAPSAKKPTLIDNSLTQSPQRGLDGQGFREHGFSAGGRVETVVSDKATIFAGFNYHTAKEAIDANRLIYGAMMVVNGQIIKLPATYTTSGRPSYSYISAGNLKQEIITGNVGAQLKPVPDFSVELALKSEQYKDSGYNEAVYYSNWVTPATAKVQQILLPAHQDFKNIEKPVTPSIDVRYTGIHSVALYGSWEYRDVSQDERTNYGAFNAAQTNVPATGGISVANTLAYDSIKEKHGDAKIGANWTPIGLFTARAEVFTKDHENRFNGYGPSAGDMYVLDYDIVGVKLTGIVKPIPAVSFTTRYVAQHGKAKSGDDSFAEATSGDSKRFQLSETVDWNPNKSVYAQANGSISWDNIVTAYPYVTGTAKDVIRNAKNNYWNGNVIVGFVLTKEADAQLEGTYYKADNYDPAQAYATMPYGAGAQESTVTVGIKYRILPKTLLTAKAGYIDSKNDTTGSFANFRGPLAYVAIEHAF
jgi:hypothetical protein